MSSVLQWSGPQVSSDFKVIQYPASMRLRVDVQNNAPDRLLPPTLYIS
jgi:hypothetical protein